MKLLLIALTLAALGGGVAAQTGAPAAPVPPATSAQAAQAASRASEIAVERGRIVSERSRLEAGFLAEDSACYQRFAVNNCLDDVNTRRRSSMADLRRQEILLNDEERKIRGAEQIRKTEEKAAPEKQREAADRRAKAIQDYQSRMGRDQDKAVSRDAARAAEQSNTDAAAARQRANAEKAQQRAERQAGAAEEAQKFNARQKEAQERRAQHEADKLKNPKQPAKPLPPPP